MSNPFAAAEAWDVSGGFLPSGDHVVEILEIDGSGNSSGGHPEIQVKVGNADGEIRDWIVVIDSTIGKVIQLTDAAGLSRPDDSEVIADGTGYRLSPAYLAQMLGKRVGVIVRPETDRMDPTRTRDRIKGYADAGRIAKSDVTPTAANGPTRVGALEFPAAVNAAPKDDTIPF